MKQESPSSTKSESRAHHICNFLFDGLPPFFLALNSIELNPSFRAFSPRTIRPFLFEQKCECESARVVFLETNVDHQKEI